MADFTSSLYNMRLMDELACKDTFVHKLHPLIKILTTIAYLFVVVSYDRHEIIGLLPMIFYPVVVFFLAELPVKQVLARLLLIEPFIIAIGILNPFFDSQVITVGGLALSRGWITFASILLKSLLTITAALILICTTGMDKLAAGLRMLKVPRLFVLQLLLTYRYISVLIEEVSRSIRAYKLRAPQQKGIHPSAWGTLVGQLLLRTIDRAERVYQAMCVRGFTGEYYAGADTRITVRDGAYFGGWLLFFIFARMINIPLMIGLLISGVIS
ncbi:MULTISPECIES: cobalt ECF transporter T component CbiQ [unclassified Dehalobacter]|uniref:cobalt ECF transporter T component CbiQ n=1 Tax=unclassified Dehalobacter TaxID=2635733 RepID=UPI001872D097|nr:MULTISPECIES: cobalt ECF transporter T component CbiQ [unclassified Dehalobacter]